MALNIRTKLTLAVTLLFACLLAVVAWFTVERFRSAMKAEIFRTQFAMLGSAAEELDTRLVTAHMTLKAAADTFPVEILNDPDRVQALLDGRDDLHQAFDNKVFVFTAKGAMYVESPFAPNRRGKDFSFREYIVNTLKGGQPYISAPYISTQSHQHPVIMMTAPIRDREGRILAILTGSLDLMRDNFLGKLKERRIGERGYFYLTTGDRITIMHPDPKRIFKPSPPGRDAAYDAAIAGFQGTRESRNAYGQEMYASFKQLHEKNWLLAANYPVEEALAPLRAFQRKVAALAVAGMLLCALLVHFLMGRLLAPLFTLSRHMTNLEEKQGDARLLPTRGGDEIGHLTASFNTMVRALDQKQADLENQEALYRTVVRFANDFVYWRGADGRMRYVSENARRITGHDADDFYRFPSLLDDIVHPEDRDIWLGHTHKGGEQGEPIALEFRIVSAAGEVRWVSHVCQQVLDDAGVSLGMRGSHRDITLDKQSAARQRLAGAVFESAREAILVCDADNRIVAVNPAFSVMTGYTEAEVLGRNPSLLQSGETPADEYADLWRSLEQHGHWQGELFNRRRDGVDYHVLAAISAVRDDRGRITHYVGIESDITAMKEAEERIEYLAYHDPLTGLPNRALLLERADLALALAHRRHEGVAVLFLDLDRFKQVNDSLGHAAGDALLIEAGRRLSALVREADTVSRLGGDEFVLLLLSAGEEGAREVADKVLLAMREAYSVEGHGITLSTSVGIALYPQDGADMGELLKNADTALYQAKQEGRNAMAFYNRDMNVATFEKLLLEAELKQAIERGELVTYYQPKVDLESGRLTGAEALIRWRHPQHGLVPPGRFIPVAETSGLINDICRWVLADVCRQVAAWRREGLVAPRIAVNLTPRDFRSASLPRHIASLLNSHQLTSSALELELTESTLLDAGKQVLDNLAAIQHLGVTLAIDDFGTGYSSLGYLRRLPIGVLKIDRSFVHDLETNAEGRTLAGSIIALGHSLGLDVVAEGVETNAQRDILLNQGCRVGQGFLFSPPVPADEFANWLKRDAAEAQRII